MRIAYIVSAYPLLTQTFVANEMIEMQEAGQDVLLAPLYSASRSSVHHKVHERLRPVTVLPNSLFDLKVMFLALCMFFKRPLKVLGTLTLLHWSAGLNLYAHASIMAVTPKALATAWRLRREKVDRIHAHFATHTTTCAAIAGIIGGIPFSFTAHAYDVYRTTLKHRNDTLDWKLRHAVQVFAVSKYLTKLLRQRVNTANGHIHTAYVGIPMNLFRSESPSLQNGTMRLLCVARFAETKGLDTLIDACALLRDQALSFHLRLFGDGPLRTVLAAQVTRLGLDDYVTIGGPIPQEEVARQLQICQLFVMPCRQDPDGDMDGIPTVFMEAMAMGRPVISCPISGIPELVRDGETGALVPPNDPQSVAMAILRLTRDETLRIHLGQQARALVERQHDQRMNTRRLLEIMANSSE
jgi:colanic acid/amylovoran biosynthesis glycosyltransferase